MHLSMVRNCVASSCHFSNTRFLHVQKSLKSLRANTSSEQSETESSVQVVPTPCSRLSSQYRRHKEMPRSLHLASKYSACRPPNTSRSAFVITPG